MTDPVVTTTYKTVKVKYTHYGDWIYYASFAVSFGYRAVPTTDRNCRVVRLWLDNTLIYDAYANLGNVNWVFYPGTEDQPFYRGQMVIFFGHLALGPTGAIPAVTAEIVDDTPLGSQTSALYVARPATIGATDFYGGALLHVIPEVGRTLFRTINTAANAEARSQYYPGVLDTSRPVAAAPWLSVALFNADDGLKLINYSPAFTGLGGGFGSGSATAGEYDDFPLFDTALAQNAGNLFSASSTFWLLASPEQAGSWPYQVLYLHNGSLVYGGGVGLEWSEEPICLARGERDGGASLPEFMRWGQPAANSYGDVLAAFAHSVRRVRVGALGSDPTPRTVGFGPASPELTPSINDAEIYSHDPSVGAIRRIVAYNMLGMLTDADNPIILLIETDAVNHIGFARKIAYDGTILWDSDPFDLDDPADKHAATLMSSADCSAGRLCVISAHTAARYTMIDLDTGTVIVGTYDTGTVTIDATKPYMYSSVKDTIYLPDNDQHCVQVNLPGSTAIPIADAISYLAQRAGYAESDIVINGLDDVTIMGYVIGSDVTLEDVLDNLQTIYQFTYAEIGDKLFVQGIFDDSAFLSQITIPETDLAVLQEAREDVQQIISSVVGDPSKIPQQITVRYIDPDLDFQQNAQTVRRNVPSDLPTVQSDALVSVDIPIVATGDQMLALLYRALYASWASQNPTSIRLPPKYLALIPTDGFTFSALGYDHRVTAVSVTLNADFSISLSTVERLPASTLPTVNTQEPSRPVPRGPVAPVRALLLDIPDTSAASEADDVLNLGVALSGYAPNRFTSARLETANAGDPTSWAQRLTTPTEAPIGQVVAIEGDRSALGPFETDTATRITFALGAIPSGYFSAATYAECLAGANRIVVGRDSRFEIMQFMDYTDNGNGTATIGGLFRGRFGTDAVIPMLSVGDFVVSYDALSFISYPVADFLGHLVYAYHGIVPGQDIATVEQSIIIPQGIAKRPWAPVQMRASRKEDGSIDLWWRRRERFNAALTDGTASVPAAIGRSFSVDLWREDKSGIYFRSSVQDNSADGYDHITIDAATIEAAGYASDEATIHYYVYQHDPVIGRGWGGNGFDTPVDAFEEGGGSAGGIVVGSDGGFTLNMKRFRSSGLIDSGSSEATIAAAMQTITGASAVSIEPVATINGAMQHVGVAGSLNTGSAGPPSAQETSSIVSSTGTTSLAVPIPSNVASGDLLIACIAAGSGSSIVAPSGWTLLDSAYGSRGNKGATFYRICDGSETSSYTWTWTNSSHSVGQMVRVTNANPSAPIDAHAVQCLDSGNRSPLQVPSVTTTATDDLLIGIAIGGWETSGPMTFDSGYTALWNAGSTGAGGSDSYMAADTKTISSAGATGTHNITPTFAVFDLTFAIAIKG